MDFEDSDRLDTPDLQIYITDAVEVGRRSDIAISDTVCVSSASPS
jgi:hypothetical protein